MRLKYKINRLWWKFNNQLARFFGFSLYNRPKLWILLWKLLNLGIIATLKLGIYATGGKLRQFSLPFKRNKQTFLQIEESGDADFRCKQYNITLILFY